MIADNHKDFFEKKLTQEEAKEFLEFLESQEAEELLSAEIIQLWSSKLKSGEYQWDNNALWEKLNANKSGYPRPFVQTSQPQSKKWLPWTRAAVVFLAIGISALFFVNRDKYRTDQDQEQLLDIRTITHTNPAGKKSKFTLPDGSTVYLNSESSISYQANFRMNRAISLEGEGYFDVVKDPDHPFKVESNGIVTTALGTSFNISTFEPNDRVSVTLLTGKVEIKQLENTHTIQLIPGEGTILSRTDKELKKSRVEAADRILWTQGILKFSNLTMVQMAEKLERWYDVEITIQGNTDKQLASGTFDADESLRNVLVVLSESLDFSFELEGKKVFVKLN